MSDRRGPKRADAGMTLAEVMVAAAVALIGFLIALVLYTAARDAFKRGEQASDQQQQTRVAYDRMLKDIRLAGYNWDSTGEARPGEEQIEGAWGGAITIRGDYDYSDPTLSADPETYIAGSTNQATIGNDEIVTYCLKKPDNSGGASITFNADVDSSTTATSPTYGTVAARDGTTEAVTIPNVDQTQTSPPYDLYRVTLSNRHTDFGTSGFVQYQLLAENVKSLKFTYYDASGAVITAPGGADDAASKATRASIRRIQVQVTGMTGVPDPKYTDASDTVAASQHYRKFDLTTDVTPRNLGLKGQADTDLTPPTTPTGFALCVGHCGGIIAKWNPNPSNQGVTQYTVKYGTSPGLLGSQRSTPGTFLYIGGLTEGTTYYFTVRAEDASNNASPESSQLSAAVLDTTPPNHTVPAMVNQGNFAATGAGGTGMAQNVINMNWAPLTTNATALACDPQGNVIRDLAGYRLYKSYFAGFGPVDPGNPFPNRIADETVLTSTATTFSDSAVVNCRPYYYKLRAIDLNALPAVCGNVSADWTTASDGMSTTAIAPAAPTGVSAGRTGLTSAHIAWTAVTTDTATPTPNPIIIDKYNIYRTFIATGLDPETATYTLVNQVQGFTYFDDSTCPADTPGFSVYYKVTAVDDCPNESAKSTSSQALCNFNGNVILTPSSSPPGPSLTLGTQTLTVSVSGTDTYTQSQIVITYQDGSQDFTQTQTTAGPVWTYSWTPAHGAGTYIAVANVTNSFSCIGQTVNRYTVIVLSCDTCAQILAGVVDPSSGGNKFYRLENTIRNTCAYPLEMTKVVIREKSPTTCTSSCTSPILLQTIQYIQTGSFIDETSNVVYTSPLAPGQGDPVSTTESATAIFPSPFLVLPASSTSAKMRFIFKTSTPVWESGTQSNKKHTLLGDFFFNQISNLCTPGSLNNQQLD